MAAVLGNGSVIAEQEAFPWRNAETSAASAGFFHVMFGQFGLVNEDRAIFLDVDLVSRKADDALDQVLIKLMGVENDDIAPSDSGEGVEMSGQHALLWLERWVHRRGGNLGQKEK